MITVAIEAWPLLGELFGGNITERFKFSMDVVKGTTLEGLIGVLCTRHPLLGRFFIKTDKNELCGTLELVSVILNSHMITSKEDYLTLLKEGDRIIFTQGFAGG